MGKAFGGFDMVRNEHGEKMLTTGEVVQRLGRPDVDDGRVRYLVKSRRLVAGTPVGGILLFPESVVAELRNILNALDTGHGRRMVRL